MKESSLPDLCESDVFRPADPFEFADYGIVFGCDFRSEMEFRIAHAIELVKSNHVGKLVLSGGVTGDATRSEAEEMESIALKAGLSGNQLLCEKLSRTTQQNVLCCWELLQRREPNRQSFSVALITSDWHMARVWMLARKHLPEKIVLLCSPMQTTCHLGVWDQTIQCACLIRSELSRIKYVREKGYPDPRIRQSIEEE